MDGLNFEKVNTTAATGAKSGSTTYNWLDASPVNGNNFYRISSTSPDGSNKYSKVALVKMDNAITGIRIYPNPVTDGIIGMEFRI